ncbi:transglutaminase TgpA family protein [Salimicrobium halophilum]|uniref:Transglutaminase-like enzyme, putative cysteine protease n=1 Tax=Salimicrobium halophilum TaxID=86666 RepID=A0A1G8UF44_9BACI|nr:transglutaminaseTgpA domain-containing protein [Salimicrobium halophilum]SDJ52388.1 Transglutaminase-like enzyme, putative cysteine protease [Salimicrobium halophilum]
MKEKSSSLLLFLVYAGGFLLLLEWLWPLDILTDTQSVSIFYLYAAFCFFLTFMQVPWYFAVPLKLLGLLFILDGLFIGERIFSEAWWLIVYNQLSYNLQAVTAQEWWELTAFFRSFLFLVLLWLVSYLLHFWLVIARKAFFFIVLTFVYITIIDTFTPYEGQASIIRTFIIAMVVLGLLHVQREFGGEDVGRRSRNPLFSAIPLITVILIAAVGATILPKFAPQWPDPVPYLQSATGGIGPGGNGNVVQKVGYGENDSRLGGSFVQDDTLVFQAVVRDRQYWRIESKDRYTGKGWEDTLEQPVTSVGPDELEYSTFEDDVEAEPSRGFLDFTDQANFRKLVYPYGVTSLGNLERPIDIALHTQTGEMETRAGNDSVQPERYSLNYDAPSFELNTLRDVTGGDPASIQEKYLQLPSSVTQRTRELAAEITAEHDNRYDKAKAVESYFSSNGFEYTTTDVAVPEEDEDYVDQFVFETQQGYCDNYSTSMIVMLRAEGIPARWVKGFTGGELTDTDTELFDTTMNSYDVTSANAHSWVEVYFPDVGWVPFEPTQGFTNNADFYTEVDTDPSESGQDETESPEVDTPEQEEQGNPQQIGEEEEETAGTASGGNDGISGTTILLSALGVLSVIGIALYLTRLRWLSWYYGRRFRRQGDADAFQSSYRHLLNVLDKRIAKRRSDETLRAYAKAIDHRFEGNDMQRLTNQYERLVYRKEDRLQRNDISELWENLIKKALS